MNCPVLWLVSLVYTCSMLHKHLWHLALTAFHSMIQGRAPRSVRLVHFTTSINQGLEEKTGIFRKPSSTQSLHHLVQFPIYITWQYSISNPSSGMRQRAIVLFPIYLPSPYWSSYWMCTQHLTCQWSCTSICCHSMWFLVWWANVLWVLSKNNWVTSY